MKTNAVSLSPSQIAGFQRWVLSHYQDYGRHHLPWRQTRDPYQIMVSELMLQQTQVERVIPKFRAFLAQFPDPAALATASPATVIQAWQGLGYNRRGLNLQRAAQAVMAVHGGHVPATTTELLALPGIGPYTAAAIQAFAFNQPVTVIETNIRTVFIFHFFHETYDVADQLLTPLIDSTLDRSNPRQWYSALMDYGSYLKSQIPNPSRRSKHYVKQSRFAGSKRQLRGAILKVLTQSPSLSTAELSSALEGLVPHTSLTWLPDTLEQLQAESFLAQEKQLWRLSE